MHARIVLIVINHESPKHALFRPRPQHKIVRKSYIAKEDNPLPKFAKNNLPRMKLKREMVTKKRTDRGKQRHKLRWIIVQHDTIIGIAKIIRDTERLFHEMIKTIIAKERARPHFAFAKRKRARFVHETKGQVAQGPYKTVRTRKAMWSRRLPCQLPCTASSPPFSWRPTMHR